jgi:hypothetical protein
MIALRVGMRSTLWRFERSIQSSGAGILTLAALRSCQLPFCFGTWRPICDSALGPPPSVNLRLDPHAAQTYERH